MRNRAPEYSVMSASSLRSFLPTRTASASGPLTLVSSHVIAGSEATGGAGLQADLRTFRQLDTYGVGTITCIVSFDPKSGNAYFEVAGKALGADVVNLTATETFYEEKRPFFVEGASSFRFGGNVEGPGPDRHLAPEIEHAVEDVRSGALVRAVEEAIGELS